MRCVCVCGCVCSSLCRPLCASVYLCLIVLHGHVHTQIVWILWNWFSWNLFPKHSSLDWYSCHCLCLCKACVFPLVQEAQEERRRLCSRWTESDRERERWSEFLVKAAGQWGRQKLIREAASFTTPQLDQLFVCVRARVCAQAANQLAVTESERCVCLSVHVCVYVFISQHEASLAPLFSPPSFGSLTQTNPTLITSSGKPLLPNKCQLDDNFQATLEESGCSEAKQF